MAKGVSVGPCLVFRAGVGRWMTPRRAAGMLLAAIPVRRGHGRLLSLVACVWLAIFVTKAAMVFTLFGNPELPPRLRDGRVLTALGRAAACCAEDAAVGLGCLLLGGVALLWTQRAACATISVILCAAALAALVLLAVNAHVFAHLRCFLKAGHLEAAGG